MRGARLLSIWLYGALLYLYPRAFRTAYGQQMRLTFQAVCQEAYRRNGARGLLAIGLATLFDLFRSALAEWARQGEVAMFNGRLVAWAGPLLLAVGAMWLVAALGDLAFRIGLLRDEGWLGLVSIPFFLAFIPLLVALIGTRLRFHPSAGGVGKFGLALSVAGCAGVFVAVLAQMLLAGTEESMNQPSWVNYAAIVSFLSIRIGYLLFGVDVLQNRTLPRWNLLPLLLGSTVVLSFGFDWFGVPALLPMPWLAPAVHFGIAGACWVLLGLALMDLQWKSQPSAGL